MSLGLCYEETVRWAQTAVGLDCCQHHTAPTPPTHPRPQASPRWWTCCLHAPCTAAPVPRTVTANGQSMSSAEFVKLRAFVPQEDHFVVSMTALETVQFHAALDLPPDTPSYHEVLSTSRVVWECSPNLEVNPF